MECPKLRIYRCLHAALAVVTLAACSNGSAAPAGNRSSAPSEDVRAKLVASTSGLVAGNYRYRAVMPDVRIDGSVQGRDYAETMVTDDDGRRKVIDTVVIGNDRYTRVTGKSWEHLDLARLSPEQRARAVGTNPDHTGAVQLITTVKTAEADGSSVVGTLDGGLMAPVIGTAAVTSRLEGPREYTAALDESGRLVHLVVHLPARTEGALPAATWTLDVSDYGAAKAPEPPTTFTEAPAELYQTP